MFSVVKVSILMAKVSGKIKKQTSKTVVISFKIVYLILFSSRTSYFSLTCYSKELSSIQSVRAH